MRILSFIKYEIFYGIFARISVVVAITYYFEETRNSMLLSFLKYFYISPSEEWEKELIHNIIWHMFIFIAILISNEIFLALICLAWMNEKREEWKLKREGGKVEKNYFQFHKHS